MANGQIITKFWTFRSFYLSSLCNPKMGKSDIPGMRVTHSTWRDWAGPPSIPQVTSYALPRRSTTSDSCTTRDNNFCEVKFNEILIRLFTTDGIQNFPMKCIIIPPLLLYYVPQLNSVPSDIRFRGRPGQHSRSIAHHHRSHSIQWTAIKESLERMWLRSCCWSVYSPIGSLSSANNCVKVYCVTMHGDAQ